MAYILPSNKFEMLIFPVISLNNCESSKTHLTNECLLYEKLKNNYELFFNNEDKCLYKNDCFEDQLSYLYKKTINNISITNCNYNNSLFFEINELIIKYNIVKTNILNENDVFIVSNSVSDIIAGMKQNNVYYNEYFKFTSYSDNFSKNIIQNKHIFEFMFFDVLLKDSSDSFNNEYYRNLIKSIMIILNYLKKDGNCILKINLEIYSQIGEFIYFLSYLFENISIIQLESSTNTSLFIQCKNFIINKNRHDNYNKNLIMLYFLLNKLKLSSDIQFISLFQDNMPCFFKTKLNNVKNIILQQKMEIIYNLNNYFNSNHNKYNVIETNSMLQKLKNIDNQKMKRAISWCKRYNISYST